MVDISAKIVADGTGKVLAARIFTARVPVPKVDAGTRRRGLDAALARVLAEMVRLGEFRPLRRGRAPRPASLHHGGLHDHHHGGAGRLLAVQRTVCGRSQR